MIGRARVSRIERARVRVSGVSGKVASGQVSGLKPSQQGQWRL